MNHMINTITINFSFLGLVQCMGIDSDGNAVPINGPNAVDLDTLSGSISHISLPFSVVSLLFFFSIIPLL